MIVPFVVIALLVVAGVAARFTWRACVVTMHDAPVGFILPDAAEEVLVVPLRPPPTAPSHPLPPETFRGWVQ
jgi:hypothetical protein